MITLDQAQALLSILVEATEDEQYELVSVEATRNKDGATVHLLAIAKEEHGTTQLLPVAEFVDYNEYTASLEFKPLH